jgi:hypothetical protein
VLTDLAELGVERMVRVGTARLRRRAPPGELLLIEAPARPRAAPRLSDSPPAARLARTGR